MSSSGTTRRKASRFAIERELAPHVDEKWAESFVVELRLIGVEGTDIGAALSEVESHCIESGQSAREAFGGPVEYARSLPLPVNLNNSPAATTRSLMPIMVQVLGMYLLNWGFEAALRASGLEITVGRLVVPVVGLIAMVAIAWFAEPVLRAVVYRPVASSMLATLAFVAITAFCVVAITSRDEPIWEVPAGWVLAAGAIVLTAGVVWAIARLRTLGSGGDPITSPLLQAGISTNDEAATSTRASVHSRSAALPYTAMIPVATVILLAVTLMLHGMRAA